MLKVNKQTIPYLEGIRVSDIVAACKPGADLFIVNGYPVSSKTELADGDTCCLIKRDEVPTAEEMQSFQVVCHTPGVHETVSRASGGIMGLGRLGTSAAGPGQGLMAPRVDIAAHHQANQILRILLGKD